MRVRALTVGVSLLRQDLQAPEQNMVPKLAQVRSQLDLIASRLEKAGYE